MPTKDPEYEALLDKMTVTAWGRPRSSSITDGICVMCGNPAKEFRDELSKREFQISAMCQDCQDVVFPSPQEDWNGSSD